MLLTKCFHNDYGGKDVHASKCSLVPGVSSISCLISVMLICSVFIAFERELIAYLNRNLEYFAI